MELTINGLTKIYGDKIVLDIPQQVISSGEIIGLVGNNGAGKTTMLRLMLDLIKADSGNVCSNGKAVSEDAKWKFCTGSYVDKRFLIPFYTPEEFFLFVAKLYNISREDHDSRLEEYRQMMHDEILGTGKQIRHFSEGNQQKIGIIAAMMINPMVLVLDEPFNYLDPSSQIIVAELLKQMMNGRVLLWLFPATTSPISRTSPHGYCFWKKGKSSRTCPTGMAVPLMN